MNLGGIKVSSVELERCIAEGVSGLVEAAAVGVPSPGGGPEHLHLFLVLKRPDDAREPAPDGVAFGTEGTEQLKATCQSAIRKGLNPLFKVECVWLRESLPRTSSNKIMRRLLRDEVQQRPKL